MTTEPIQFVDLKAQRQCIGASIDTAIRTVLEHGQYIMGPEVAALEKALKDYTGAGAVVSCSSGTDALLMSLMALGVGKGDAVICPDFTYTATPESIALLGATPILVDVDRKTYNVQSNLLDEAKSVAAAGGLRLRGTIAVDLFGRPADYETIVPWANENGLFVLADAAQSFGATKGGQSVGTFGTMTATSFFPAKPLGCYGDGGAIFTDDPELAAKLTSIRSHGKSQTGGKYDIDRIGLNGRLDTLQAAILLEKLGIYDNEKRRRQTLAQRFFNELNNAYCPPSDSGSLRSAWAQYTIQAPDGRRPELRSYLDDRGIPTAIYYPKPLHKQKAYKNFPKVLAEDPFSSALASSVLSLPIHPYLSDAQQLKIIEALNAFMLT